MFGLSMLFPYLDLFLSYLLLPSCFLRTQYLLFFIDSPGRECQGGEVTLADYLRLSRRMVGYQRFNRCFGNSRGL